MALELNFEKEKEIRKLLAVTDFLDQAKIREMVLRLEAYGPLKISDFTRRLAFHPGTALNCRDKLKAGQFIREEPAARGKLLHLTEKGRIVARALKELAVKIAEYQGE